MGNYMEKLNFSSRAKDVLEKANIKTVEELCELTIDVAWEICNCDKTLLIEILEKLKEVILV